MKRRVRSTHTPSSIRSPKQGLFWFLVAGSFLALLWYRVIFYFPVWFDEVLAKAFLFGLPVLIYTFVTRQSMTLFGLDPKRFWLGAYVGLSLGGSFGFLAMLASALKRGHILIPYLFFSTDFWWTFMLALATAWWESLFFYGFILSILLRIYKNNEWEAALAATGLFLIFHAPVLILRGGVQGALLPLILLGTFAFGQAVMYLRYKSLVSMVVSHAFWGMALLVYTLK